MKKMKTTIAVALAACVSTSLFAQAVVKQDTITISLTGAKQLSVSTSASVANAGNWSSGPMFYKTTPVKVTDKDIIKYIGFVLYNNANHYSSTKAKLVLVQGELSGFFNITPALGLSTPDRDTFGAPFDNVDPWFNDMGGSADGDSSTALANSQDSTTFQLANGRHWDVNPLVPTMYPVGHLQPWGQIYIQDPTQTVSPSEENVTYFFAISIEECYDCFYLNSFISTASFKTQNTAPNGPPCCTGESVIVGSGKDAYYMTFSFDDTENNPYLAPGDNNPLYFGDEIGNGNVVGVASTLIQGDGIVPDNIKANTYAATEAAAEALALAGGATPAEALAAGVKAADLAAFRDPIKSGLGSPSPYEARFTLNGVLTYTWKLAQIDKQDLLPDFLGTGSYVANGYGFIGLSCTLFNTATITFSEKAVKAGTAVTGENWTDSWIGVGAEYVTQFDNEGTAVGVATAYDNWYNNLGQQAYVWGGAEDQFAFGGYPTPINVSTSLSYHENFNNQYPAHNANPGWAAWPTPAYVKSFYLPQ